MKIKREENPFSLPWNIDDLISFCCEKENEDFRYSLIASHLRDFRQISNAMFDGNLIRLDLKTKHLDRVREKRKESKEKKLSKKRKLL